MSRPRLTPRTASLTDRRCIAPVSDDDETLCGQPATTDRVVEGLVCPLCAEHAAEIDRETQQ
jgi:hypothetical protein